MRDTGICPCEPAGDLLARRIDDIDAEIRALATLREELVNMSASLASTECRDPWPDTWTPRSLRVAKEVNDVLDVLTCETGCCPECCGDNCC